MKNLFVYSLITLISVICALPLGCEKDNPKSERFNLLTNHTWYYDSFITICQDSEILWFIDMLNNDVKGSTVTFTANGKFTSPYENGSWKFNNGETEIITFDSDDPTDIYGHVRIDVLTEDILEVTDLVDVPPSDTCYFKTRLVK